MLSSVFISTDPTAIEKHFCIHFWGFLSTLNVCLLYTMVSVEIDSCCTIMVVIYCIKSVAASTSICYYSRTNADHFISRIFLLSNKETI